MLNREQIVRALTRLAAVLEARGVQGEVYLVGGAAIALAYDARRATRDVDAVFAPKQAVYEAAQVVAEELNLPENWLNDAVKLYLRGEDPEPLQPLDLPGLRVLVASPRYLLALKLLASRREDEQDIRTLLNLLQIQSVDEALAVVLQVYPEGQILPKTRFMLEEIFGGQSHGERRLNTATAPTVRTHASARWSRASRSWGAHSGSMCPTTRASHAPSARFS
jgi:predicted nucleotidyltransferase